MADTKLDTGDMNLGEGLNEIAGHTDWLATHMKHFGIPEKEVENVLARIKHIATTLSGGSAPSEPAGGKVKVTKDKDEPVVEAGPKE